MEEAPGELETLVLMALKREEQEVVVEEREELAI